VVWEAEVKIIQKLAFGKIMCYTMSVKENKNEIYMDSVASAPIDVYPNMGYGSGGREESK
jgi:hypothetical protein